MLYQCPYCGKTHDDPNSVCCGECHLEAVTPEQAEQWLTGSSVTQVRRYE